MLYLSYSPSHLIEQLIASTCTDISYKFDKQLP